MANSVLDLLGTSLNQFWIANGANRILLKNISGALNLRNKADNADVPLTVSQLNASGDQIVINSDGANTGTDRVLTLARSNTQSTPVTVRFPPAKGTDGFALVQLAGSPANEVWMGYADPSTIGTPAPDVTTLAFGSASPLAMFNLPINAEYQYTRLIVDTVFNGTPSISIGITGTLSKYAPASAFDLTDSTLVGVNQYYHPGLAPIGTVEALISTYTAGGATQGSARIYVHFSVPT